MTIITLFFTLLFACKHQSKKETSSKDSILTSVSEKEISQKIELEPSNPELFYQRSLLFYEEKKLDRSLSDIEVALTFNKQNPLYHYFKGRVLYAMNLTLKASDEYEEAIKLKPDYTEAQLKAGELFYIVKEHQRSLKYLDNIIGREPGNSIAYFFRGMNLKEMKDTAKAIDAFQKAYENDKNFYDAVIQLGLIFSAKNNKLAAEYFSSAIRINPKNDEAYFARGVYFQNNKKFSEALTDYRKVIDLNPGNDKAYYNVGYLNFESKHFDEAMKNFDQCIRLNNDNDRAYYMRGLVNEINGDKQKAKLNYEYALRLRPDYALAKEGLGRVDK